MKGYRERDISKNPIVHTLVVETPAEICYNKTEYTLEGSYERRKAEKTDR